MTTITNVTNSEAYTNVVSTVIAWDAATTKADKLGAAVADKLGTMARAFIEIGFKTPAHFKSPHTNDHSPISAEEWQWLLNTANLLLPDSVIRYLPRTIAKGTIFFDAGTRDVDDYAKNDPIRALVIDAGRQGASKLGKIGKAVCGLIDAEARAEMSEEQKEDAAANSDHTICMQRWGAFMKACGNKKSQAFCTSIQASVADVSSKLSADGIAIARMIETNDADEREPSH